MNSVLGSSQISTQHRRHGLENVCLVVCGLAATVAEGHTWSAGWVLEQLAGSSGRLHPQCTCQTLASSADSGSRPVLCKPPAQHTTSHKLPKSPQHYTLLSKAKAVRVTAHCICWHACSLNNLRDAQLLVESGKNLPLVMLTESKHAVSATCSSRRYTS